MAKNQKRKITAAWAAIIAALITAGGAVLAAWIARPASPVEPTTLAVIASTGERRETQETTTTQASTSTQTTTTARQISILEQRVNEAVRQALDAEQKANDAKALAENTDEPNTQDGYAVLSTGDTYAGQFKNGHYNGYGVYSWPSRQTYAGQFKNGQSNGYGVYSWSNGQTYAGQFKEDGKRDGYGAEYYADGSLKRQGRWENGKLIDEVE
ncbi:MAG: hypothetical protein LBB75_01005 [Oscillospiraceae bacterium]|jgi:hypothetical protein|nr:hypothetical protein [Oscillospiraceae bacterium]